MKRKKTARKHPGAAAPGNPREGSAPPDARSTWLWCAAILILAFSIRLDTIFSGGFRHRVLRGFESQAIADSLVKTGQFANPFRYETGPTAHLAPAFPLWLAGLMTVFGDDSAYETAKQLLSALAASLHYALLPALAVVMGFPRRVGILAGFLSIFLFVVLPGNIRPLETQGSWENTYAALGMVVLSILTAATFRERHFTWGRAARWGLCWGAFLLLTPVMAAVYFAWLALGLACCGRGERLRYAGFAALSTACLMAVLAPWTIRNLRVLGSPVWGRSNFGLELSVSNNDCAAPTFAGMYRSGCHGRSHPNVNREEARRMRDAGEVTYNSGRLRAALTWIAANPARFARLTAQRFVLFWFPDMGAGAASYAVWVLTVFGFLGLGWSFRENRFAGLMCGSLLLVYPLVYYVVQHLLRYRYPVLWVSSMLASYGITAAWERRRAR